MTTIATAFISTCTFPSSFTQRCPGLLCRSPYTNSLHHRHISLSFRKSVTTMQQSPPSSSPSSSPPPPPPPPSSSSSSSSSPSSSPSKSRRDTVVDGPFQGQFGTWYLKQRDVDDVFSYRVLLTLCATQVLLCVLLANNSALRESIPHEIFDIFILGATWAFGLSLNYIHIYLRPLHTALKICWAVGMVGMGLCTVTMHSVVDATVHSPWTLLASGWVLVSLTGVFVKEAFCFRKIQALALTALTPTLALGHFLQLLTPQQSIEPVLVNAFAVIFMWFALSKFTQPATDDIGDMSVFMYLDEQKQQ